MFKEGQPGPERAFESEQFGFSQHDVDRMYQEAFRDEVEGVSDIHFEIDKVLGALLDQAGFRLEFSDGATAKTSKRFPIEAAFLRKDEGEDDDVMLADFGLDFSVDAAAGTVTFTLEPLAAQSGQYRQQDAAAAMEQIPRTLTLTASAAQQDEMKRLKSDIERNREEARAAHKRFIVFAEAHQDRDLTPEDYAKHRLELGPLPNVDHGTWRLEKKGNRWRFIWFDGPTLRDVIEFGEEE